MKTLARPDPEPLHAATFALRAWVLAAAAIVAGWVQFTLPRSWRIEARRFVREAISDLRELIVLLALAQCRCPRLQVRTKRPRSAPKGFRRGRHNGSALRMLKRLVRVPRGTIATQLKFMRAAFGNLKRAIGRVLAVLENSWLRARFVAVAPAAVLLAPLAAPDAQHADTS